MNKSPPLDDLFNRTETAIEQEYKCTQAEINALEEFIDRVSSLSLNSSNTTDGFPPVDLILTECNSPDPIRQAYISTLMSVDHYDEEYDESFAEHFGHELGADLAAVVTGGMYLSSHHQKAIVVAARDSQKRRERLLKTLETEYNSVERLSDSIRSLSATVETLESRTDEELPCQVLDGYQTRIPVLKQRCHALIDERQEALVKQRRSLMLPISGDDLATYVYADLDVNYPLVTTLTDLLERVDNLEDRIQTSLVNCS